MHFTIQRSKLSSEVKDPKKPDRACLLGQMRSQAAPEEYARQGYMLSVSDAQSLGVVRAAGLTAPPRPERVFLISDEIRAGAALEAVRPQLADLFPGHTFDIID